MILVGKAMFYKVIILNTYKINKKIYMDVYFDKYYNLDIKKLMM